MQRGEVWWADWPRGQRHPVLLLSWDAHRDWRDRVTVAPVTRNIRGIDAEVSLGPPDGMPRRCVANLDDLQTIPRRALDEHITTLTARRMGDVAVAVHRALGMVLPCQVGED